MIRKTLLAAPIAAVMACVSVPAFAQETAPAPSEPQPVDPTPLPPPTPSPDPTSNAMVPEPEPAPADAPATERTGPRPHFVLGAFVGYGTASFNTGLGLRVGYMSRSRVYIGGLFQYHFGESEETGSAGFTTTTGVTYFIHQFELGYAGRAGPVEIRPYFGLGPGFGFTSREGYLGGAPAGSTGRTHPTAVITPIGLSIAVDLGKLAYVGVDGRPMFFAQTMIPQAAFGLIAGARF